MANFRSRYQINHQYLSLLLLMVSGVIIFAGLTGCGSGGGSAVGTTSGSGSGSSGSGSGSSGSGSGTSGSGSGTSGSGTGSSGVKPILIGLVSMGSETFVGTNTTPTNNLEEINAHPGVYSAAVIELQWSQLEPQENVFDDSALVSALANIQAYNAKYPSTPVVAKLRIFAGLGTPAWVIQATGPVSFTDSSGNTGQIGKFWTAQYQTFWQGLQNHLASEYDTNPLIGEVAITSCCSLTAEPFIEPITQSAIATFHQAGYTDAQEEASLSGAAAEYSAWKETPLDFTFNTFYQTDSGSPVSDPAFTIQVMDAFRAALGTRAVVANHGLNDPLAPAAVPIFNEFQNLYNQAAAASPPTVSPLEFQTYGPTVNWPTVISYGLTFHPTEIEIWDTVAAGGSANISQSELAGWAASLKSMN